MEIEFHFAKESWRKKITGTTTHLQHAPRPLRKNNLYYTTCYFPTAQCSIPRKTWEASKTQKESEKKKDKACLQIEIGLKGNLIFLHKLQEKSLNCATPSPIRNTSPLASTLILHASATRHLLSTAATPIVCTYGCNGASQWPVSQFSTVIQLVRLQAAKLWE